MSLGPEGTPVVTPGPLIVVDDPEDPRLDLYRDLNDPAAGHRQKAGEPVVIVEGRLAVERLLTSTYSVRSLLVDDHQLLSAGELVTATRNRGAPVLVASRAVVADTVGFALHRGVVAVANRPAPARPEAVLAGDGETDGPAGAPPLIAVLEGLNDHENIGALFRNAAAFGVTGVLLDPTCADPLYRRSIRVSVGYALHIPFARLVPWLAGLQQVRAAGFLVAALAPRPPAESRLRPVSPAELKQWMSGPDHPAGLALLLGAEGPGLTEAALAAADVVVSIAMAGEVDSLNVATAAAVVFHALAGG